MTTVRALLGAALVLGAFTLATAKLPPPPPLTDAQKAAAEEKKGKDAAAADSAKKQQAQAEDRVAARYIAEQKAKGNVVTPQMPLTANAPVAPPAKAPEPAPAKK
jgi:hypothetical protein